MEIATLGIDLSETTFHLLGLNQSGWTAQRFTPLLHN